MFWDYECHHCGARREDEWYARKDRPATLPCACGQAMPVDLGGWKGGIDTLNPGMYGKYHPGFDTVVSSYGHKQQLLKEHGVIESADATKGSKCYVPSDYSESDPNKGRATPATPAIWSDKAPR